jgi:hypothetical protein
VASGFSAGSAEVRRAAASVSVNAPWASAGSGTEPNSYECCPCASQLLSPGSVIATPLFHQSLSSTLVSPKLCVAFGWL